MSGTESPGNSTSSTGPMTWTTFPSAMCAMAGALLQCGRAAHDLRDLLRDHGLAGLVVFAGEALLHLARVVGRVLHRDAARELLARDRREQDAVEDVLHVRVAELVEDLGRRRLEEEGHLAL